MKFLIIDDSKAITDPLKELISEEGHDCVVENDGQKGLKRIKEQKWDAVLLDLAMPGFSGYNVLEQLENEKAVEKNKIIVFTASSLTDGELENLKARGIHSCLRKPTGVENVLKALGIS